MKPFHRFFPILFRILLLLRASAAVSQVSLGSSATAGAGALVWTSSPGGAFAAGVRQVDATQDWAFAVWYQSIADSTIVWIANRDALIPHSFEVANSSIRLTAHGDLQLFNPSSNQTVWSSNTSGRGVVKAALLDSGNLVLLNSSGQAVWESFDSPTDTLLPGQTFREGSILTAPRSSQNASSGSYQLLFRLSDGTLVLAHVTDLGAYDMYWPPAGEAPPSAAAGMASALLDSAGIFNVNGRGGAAQHYTASDFNDSRMRRVTLNADGNLRMYSWDAGGSSWVVVWYAMGEQCKIRGLCGQFAFCAYYPIWPTCTCPPGFHARDTKDQTQGCARNVPLGSCNGSSPSNGVKLVRLPRTDYYSNDLVYSAAVSEKNCTLLCLENCSCLGLTYKADGSGSCYLKSSTVSAALVNGIQDPESDTVAYVKVSAHDNSSGDLPDNWSTIDLSCQPQLSPPLIAEAPQTFLNGGLPAIYAIATAEFVCLFLAWWFLRAQYQKRSREDGLNKASEMISGIPSRFSFKELQEATGNFSELLGSGGFGRVYKGELADGRQVAVKRLAEGVNQGEKEFKAEVKIISQVHHINLVSLLGYCSEGAQHRLLVYEYMANGSLDRALFPSIGATSDAAKLAPTPGFSWAARHKVALGIARGIAYLHEECQDWILHCDIKPQNILLDERWRAKLADFGLARLADRSTMLSMSAIRGTRGYLAPEWLGSRPITAKADVYSFGIVLMEIVSGLSNTSPTGASTLSSSSKDNVDLGGSSPSRVGHHRISQWCYQKMQAGQLKEVVDPELLTMQGAELVDWEQVQIVMGVALWCIQVEVAMRPSMGNVVQMLEEAIPVPPPPMPTFNPMGEDH